MSRAFLFSWLLLASPAAIHAASPWHIAPPFTPQSDEARRAELADRRSKIMQRIGPDGILILFSAEPNIYANDIEFPYREDNDFYYLTGVRQTGAALILIPGAVSERELLFLPAVNRTREVFYGSVIPPEQAQALSGVQQIDKIETLPALLTTLAPRLRADLAVLGPELGHAVPPDKTVIKNWNKVYAPVIDGIRQTYQAQLYLVLPPHAGAFENQRPAMFARSLVSQSTSFAIHDATPLFRALRQIKSPSEIALIQHAIDISAEAFGRVCATIAPGEFEYDLQAQFDFTFTRRHAHWGYPPIVGAGPNATTLHYSANAGPLSAGALVVIDAGAEFEQYSADVTRTFPVNGKFSPEQADIYRVVYAAQQAAIAAARPGTVIGAFDKIDADSYQGRAAVVAKQGLLRLGLITSVENDEFRYWYLHGMTHQLGMNVHDPGSLYSKLEPGMVLTDEPGIYIRSDALDILEKTPENERFIAAVKPAFEKYKGIGVRIEDDLLITDGEAKVLSAAIPSKLEDVESQIARLRIAIRKAPLL